MAFIVQVHTSGLITYASCGQFHFGQTCRYLWTMLRALYSRSDPGAFSRQAEGHAHHPAPQKITTLPLELEAFRPRSLAIRLHPDMNYTHCPDAAGIWDIGSDTLESPFIVVYMITAVSPMGPTVKRWPRSSGRHSPPIFALARTRLFYFSISGTALHWVK
jgi:hypothetical protein